jgi:hypothetical protein
MPTVYTTTTTQHTITGGLELEAQIYVAWMGLECGLELEQELRYNNSKHG